MIKPASSLCNLRCKYCFYADVASRRDTSSFGIMEGAVAKNLLKNIEACLCPGDQITLVFQGGEPTLAGLGFFRQFLSETARWDKRIQVKYALQTNAVLLNEDWCQFLKENHFLVGVSLDILQDCHDSMRIDSNGIGSYKKIVRAISLLKYYNVEYNILCTLTNQLARHPQQVWNRILQADFRYIQFTPCLGELEGHKKNFYALTPGRFSKFYTHLFQNWYADYKQEKYRSIKLFDDVITYMAFGTLNMCGIDGRCQPQIIIESDGSAYPCDFYCLDKYKLGNILEKNMQELLMSSAMHTFHTRNHQQPALCSSCNVQNFCGGGCKRMQKEVCCSYNDTECGYRSFLQQNMATLLEIAQNERMLSKLYNVYK